MVWQPIQGYEGRYEISDEGEIRSLITDKIIRQRRHRGGYMQVNLANAAHQARTHYVHILVCTAFHGTPAHPDLEVLHGNRDRADNRAENLRWGTRRENADDRVAAGSNRGENNKRAVMTEAKVLQLRAIARQHTYAELAQMFGIALSTVRDIVKGLRWAHVGGELQGLRRDTLRRGERSPVAKLSDEKVLTVRANRGKIPYRVFQDAYGVGLATLSYAANGKTWAHLPLLA